MSEGFAPPRQLLARQSYFEADFYEREQQTLFQDSWTFACLEHDLTEPGDYHCLSYQDQPLVVLRDQAGALRAFHNICRHRGCEVLEGAGNTGSAIVCPYHRWTYRLSGELRGVPNEDPCFPSLNKAELPLKAASVGSFQGLVFVNPAVAPKDSFETFVANLSEHAWPHRFDDGSLVYTGSLRYTMRCNWKVFYENAIDGYHLGYLHDKTLGKIYPHLNVWHAAGRHQVWYSTEWDEGPRSNTRLSEEAARATPRLPGHEVPAYPGVVMLFPLTILSPSPWGFYVSLLEPRGPERTDMLVHGWAPAGSAGRIPLTDPGKPVSLDDLDGHPLDSGNFQIEDMWIVEKIQRALRSPAFEVGPLARGDGAEGPLMHFQQNLLDALDSA